MNRLFLRHSSYIYKPSYTHSHCKFNIKDYHDIKHIYQDFFLLIKSLYIIIFAVKHLIK